MIYRQLSLLAIVTILLFSCVSGEQPIGDKTQEQLDYEAGLIGDFIANFFDEYSPFEDENFGQLMLQKSTSDKYTVRGPQGGKAIVEMKTQSIPDLPNWNFDMDFTTIFKNYNHKGLIINSKDTQILVELDMLIQDGGDDVSGVIELTFSGTFHYSGEATGTARFKLVAEGSTADNFEDAKTKELHFSIDGIEMDTDNVDIFNNADDGEA